MNIYVGNLSWQTTDEELQDLFESYGQVSSAKVVKDRQTGRSRGFGFVEMPNDAEGQAAVDALDNFEFGGRNLKVNVARPKEDRGPRSGGSGGGYRQGGGRRPDRRQDRRSNDW